MTKVADGSSIRMSVLPEVPVLVNGQPEGIEPVHLSVPVPACSDGPLESPSQIKREAEGGTPPKVENDKAKSESDRNGFGRGEDMELTVENFEGVEDVEEEIEQVTVGDEAKANTVEKETQLKGDDIGGKKEQVVAEGPAPGGTQARVDHVEDTLAKVDDVEGHKEKVVLEEAAAGGSQAKVDHVEKETKATVGEMEKDTQTTVDEIEGDKEQVVVEGTASGETQSKAEHMEEDTQAKVEHVEKEPHATVEDMGKDTLTTVDVTEGHTEQVIVEAAVSKGNKSKVDEVEESRAKEDDVPGEREQVIVQAATSGEGQATVEAVEEEVLMHERESNVVVLNVGPMKVDEADAKYHCNGDETEEEQNIEGTKLSDAMVVDGKEEETSHGMVIEVENKAEDCVGDDLMEMADEVLDETQHNLDENAEVGVSKGGKEMEKREGRHANHPVNKLADKMALEMADELAGEMADKMAAELADELADEDQVIEGDETMAEEGQDDVLHSTEGEEGNEGGEIDEEDGHKVEDDDGDEGTVEQQMSFVQHLEKFFKEQNFEYKPPKFYGAKVNVLKLWRVVTRMGGYDHVTASKLWRTVGEKFDPPKRCTTLSWSFRKSYEKALLDYERFKTGVPPLASASQKHRQNDGTYMGGDGKATVSPATPLSQPSSGPITGSGRARRDSAARAMQGWHSQRMGNEEVQDPVTKEKGSGGKYVKKEKKLTTIGVGLKRKGTPNVLERAVKAIRAKGRPPSDEESPPSNSAVANTGKRSSKQDSMRRPAKAKQDEPLGGINPPIANEGPEADWVKINVLKHLDCFEIYALVPGLAREEVRIQCEPGGRLVIAGIPEDPDNPWGVTPFRKVISLPSRIDAHQTSAVVTLYGQLYVRVPIAETS